LKSRFEEIFANGQKRSSCFLRGQPPIGASRLAIYGVGSVGAVLGAYITKSGIEIGLVDRNVAHVEAPRACGATIQGVVNFRTPVRALFPIEMMGTCDIFFFVAKQQSNAEVIQFRLLFRRADGVDCIL
jgi:2-dehydropantoate 2-reductase